MGCKDPIAFIPKRRKKHPFGALRKHLGEIFHEQAGHRESKIVAGHPMSDHVHRCISIPPKYAVAHVVGYIKGKRAVPCTALCRDLSETHKEPCRGLPVAVGCDQGIQAVVYCTDIGHIIRNLEGSTLL